MGATVRAAREAVAVRLAAAGVPSPTVDADLLLEAALGLSRTELLLAGSRRLDAAEAGRLASLAARRAAREPLQHVLGAAHFYGLDLAVDRRVLVPRPETERLVELVLHEVAAVRRRGGSAARVPVVLDVGTGSGAVALAVKAEAPAAEVWGLDVAEDALAVARANARALGLGVHFVRSDLLDAPAAREVVARCHVLVANLPYLPSSDAAGLAPEVAADPPGALFGGETGAEEAERLTEQAWPLLQPGALLALELDPRNVHGLAARLAAWREVTILPDLTGRDRFLVARR